MWTSLRRLRARWKYRHFERDLAAEIEVHRSMAEDALSKQGESIEAARTRSARLLGNARAMREASRDVWVSATFESLVRDAQYAIRGLIRRPAFAVTAIGILALSSGLLTAIVMFADGTLWQRWPVPHASELMFIRPGAATADGLGSLRVPEYRAITPLLQEWQRIALAVRSGIKTVSFDNGDAAPVSALSVTANYFDTLETRLAAGRAFSSAEDDVAAPAAVVIVSHRIWIDHLQHDPRVIGRVIHINHRAFTIVGVAPSGFVDRLASHNGIWFPLGFGLADEDTSRQAFLDPRHPNISISVIGRRGREASGSQALQELQQLSDQYRAGAGIDRASFTLVDTRQLSASNTQTTRLLWVVGCALALVQLLACANVGNLLLASGLSRQREMAVRLSIGATRSRIVRQLLVEVAVIVTVATGAGVGLALALPALVAAINPQWMVGIDEFYGPGLITFLTVAGTAAVSAAAAGVAPALRTTDVAISTAAANAHGQSRESVRLRRVLLAAQIACATVLLVGAALLTRAFAHALAVEPGFAIGEFQQVDVTVPGMETRERRHTFYRELFGELQTPGWPPTVLTDMIPFDPNANHYALLVSMPGTITPIFLTSRPVSANYFNVIGVPMLAGRMPAGLNAPNEIVFNKLAAALLFSGEDPIGKTIESGTRADGLRTLTVVGLVPDLPTKNVAENAPTAYGPSQLFQPHFLIRSQDLRLAARVRTAAERLEPSAKVVSRPLTDAVADSLVVARVAGRLAWCLGMAGLALAAIGAFGVFSYAVEERRREVGIRMALGASGPDVVRLVLRSTQHSTIAGIAAGLLLSSLLTPLLRAYLYGLSPFDAVAFLEAGVVLAAAAGLATWLPARRATLVDPAQTLRAE